MEKPTVAHVLCPVFSHELRLITLIQLPETLIDALESGKPLVVEVAADPQAIQLDNPDPKVNQIELQVTKMELPGGVCSASFFAEDAEKALRLPCAFAPGQTLAVAETYNTGFKAGVAHGTPNRATRRGK